MSGKKSSLISNILRLEPGISFGQWVWDRITNTWPYLLIAISGGGGAAVSASFTEWLEKWGTFGIYSLGVTAFLIILIFIYAIRLLSSIINNKNAYAAYLQEVTKKADKINPLDDIFRAKIFEINQLFILHAPVLNSKNFKGCHIQGPGVATLLDGIVIHGCNFNSCNFIVVNHRKGTLISGLVGFTNTQFENCVFVNITFIISENLARVLSQQLNDIQFLGYEFQ